MLYLTWTLPPGDSVVAAISVARLGRVLKSSGASFRAGVNPGAVQSSCAEVIAGTEVTVVPASRRRSKAKSVRSYENPLPSGLSWELNVVGFRSIKSSISRAAAISTPS